jgi:CheY-like chemotaxis protein
MSDERVNLLLVDDRPENLLALEAILEPLGLWERVQTVDPKALSELIESRKLPPAVEDALLSSREEVRTQYALYLKDAARSRR